MGSQKSGIPEFWDPKTSGIPEFWDPGIQEIPWGSPGGAALPSTGPPPAKLQFLRPWGGQQEGQRQNKRSHTPDDPKGVGGLTRHAIPSIEKFWFLEM